MVHVIKSTEKHNDESPLALSPEEQPLVEIPSNNKIQGFSYRGRFVHQ